tara:strand:- start:710 stop:1795 length:1086 start_codon:yes stop_codon:yes gene_type:complete
MEKILNIGMWFPRAERGLFLAKELKKLGHKVTIYHNNPIRSSEIKTVKIKYSFTLGLIKLFATNHQIYYTSSSFTPVLQLAIFNLIKRKPYIYVLNSPIWRHWIDVTGLIRKVSLPLYPILLHFIIRQSSFTIANSKYVADLLHKKYSYKNKFMYIYNGINYKKFEIKKQYNFNYDSPKLLTVTTINLKDKYNGLIFVINSYNNIIKKIPEASLTVAIKFSREKYYKLLLQYIKEIGLSNKVKIIKNSQRIEDLFISSDILLYATPSNSTDSLPRILIEAEISKIPIISTNTMGCPEVVNSKNLLVEYDIKKFCNSILNLINNYNHFILSNKDNNEVRDKFSWHQMGIKYEKIMTNILKNN